MSTALLVITGCADPMLWYRDQVGQFVQLISDLPKEQCWLSREIGGYTNIVRHSDAMRVPQGYGPARQDTAIQPGDLLLRNGEWQCPRLEQLGTSASSFITVRKVVQP